MNNSQLPEVSGVKGKEARRKSSERNCGVSDYDFEPPADTFHKKQRKTISKGNKGVSK